MLQPAVSRDLDTWLDRELRQNMDKILTHDFNS